MLRTIDRPLAEPRLSDRPDSASPDSLLADFARRRGPMLSDTPAVDGTCAFSSYVWSGRPGGRAHPSRVGIIAGCRQSINRSLT
jgi:hypothetical protein